MHPFCMCPKYVKMDVKSAFLNLTNATCKNSLKSLCKVKTRCRHAAVEEKITLGNSQGSSDEGISMGKFFQPTNEDFSLFFRPLD